MKPTQELIAELRRLASGGKPYFEKSGICYNTASIACIQEVACYEAALYAWPKFSGDINFPVPSLNKKLKAKDVYVLSLSKWSGRYGKLRRDLCRRLADCFESGIK